MHKGVDVFKLGLTNATSERINEYLTDSILVSLK